MDMPIHDHRDVTQTIDLTDPQQVCDEVCRLLRSAYTEVDTDLIQRAFEAFAHLYAGTLPGYHRCETQYHDMQHALDVTLACARMLAGHESVHVNGHRLGAERLTLGTIVALFHDAGYIRRTRDRNCWHGAQYTPVHVTRGGRFLTYFLKSNGFGAWARRAVKLIHFTGYEIPLAEIKLDDPRDRKLGAIIGTADLIAQMADRVYLEKCRDYLYEEFELGGLARAKNPDGSERVIYDSPLDLLRKTPAFYTNMAKKRIDQDFGGCYKYLEPLFNGENPYLLSIQRNIAYLQRILEDDQLADSLRRHAEPVLAPQPSERT